jgi:hypothetical protein
MSFCFLLVCVAGHRLAVDYYQQGGTCQPHQVRDNAAALVDDEPATQAKDATGACPQFVSNVVCHIYFVLMFSRLKYRALSSQMARGAC